MLAVVDKKVVKHLIDYGDSLVEVSVRISFQYDIEATQFVPGSMERKILYNRMHVLRRLPRLDAAELDAEIEILVDQSLEEHLRYTGHASGRIQLYSTKEDEIEDDNEEPPSLIIP